MEPLLIISYIKQANTVFLQMYSLISESARLFVCCVALRPSQQLWSWLYGQFT